MATAIEISDPSLVRLARRLRFCSSGLELTLHFCVIASVLALASVHPWAYIPLWIASVLMVILLLYCDHTTARLRQSLGATPFVLDSPRSRLVPASVSGRVPGFDLREPFIPRGPLVGPGVVFLGWVALQLLPLPAMGRPLTLSPLDSVRGLAFVASALLLHVVACSVFRLAEARRRFVRTLGTLGLGLSLLSLMQWGFGGARVYGLIEPQPGSIPFGPFWNRNHYAGYMLMLVPMALKNLRWTSEAYSRRLGLQAGLRTRLLHLFRPDGLGLLEASLPLLVILASLIATTSRGALLALVASLGLAAATSRGRKALSSWVVAVVLLGVVLSWFGLERISARFARAPAESEGRTRVWVAAIGEMDGRWLTGSGLNTFPQAVRGWVGYPAAHNDYVQLLVETGVPGLGIAIWAAIAVLASVRRDPWLLASLSAVLMHVLVDFDFQIPAVGVLFACLSAMTSKAVRRG